MVHVLLSIELFPLPFDFLFLTDRRDKKTTTSNVRTALSMEQMNTTKPIIPYPNSEASCCGGVAYGDPVGVGTRKVDAGVRGGTSGVKMRGKLSRITKLAQL